MSQMHAELSELAAELGFSSIEEAEANGYNVVYSKDRADLSKEQDKAHEEWLKTKEDAIHKLESTLKNAGPDDADNVQNAIDFIKGVKYDT